MVRVILFMGALLGTVCALAAHSRCQSVSQDEKKEKSNDEGFKA
jgi:hypothetical protein